MKSFTLYLLNQLELTNVDLNAPITFAPFLFYESPLILFVIIKINLMNKKVNNKQK